MKSDFKVILLLTMLILTHFHPKCDKTDIAKECRSAYDGDLALTEDHMKIFI